MWFKPCGMSDLCENANKACQHCTRNPSTKDYYKPREYNHTYTIKNSCDKTNCAENIGGDCNLGHYNGDNCKDFWTVE